MNDALASECQAAQELEYENANLNSFSGAVTAASTTIGPIVPPSIPLVIVGTVTGTSISQLLIAGILPAS